MTMRFIDKTTLDLAQILNVNNSTAVDFKSLSSKLIDLAKKENEILPSRTFRVEKSKEYKNSRFVSQYSAGLNLIEQNFINGISNFPHQSKGASTERLDLLLNQWGIYHLHLSDNIENDGFCSRTGPVLFCCFDHDTVYFLDIMQHGSSHATVWVNEDILRVIKSNWPKHLERYEMKGVLGLAQTYTQEEKMNLRKGHVNATLEIDGKYYMSPGMGLAASGDSVRYVFNTQSIIRHMVKVISHCNDNGDYLILGNKNLKDVFPKKDKYAKRPAILRLKKKGTGLVLYEQRTSSVLHFYDLFFPIFFK